MSLLVIKDCFRLYKQKSICDVKLNKEILSYELKQSNNAKVECLNICDIIGSACMKSKSNETDHCAYLKIYAYPLVTTKGLLEKVLVTRKRKIVIFEVCKYDSLKENLLIADKWRTLINKAMDSLLNNGTSSCLESDTSLSAISNQNLSFSLHNRRKKLLIFLNPHSGPGLAEQFYIKTVEPLLYEAEIPYEFIKTEYAQHAYKIVQDVKLENYAGIVIIAGDGLLYEVYNGLLQRSDFEAALSFPIGIIPGGSGNGLSRSIGHFLNEPYLSDPVLTSTLNIINPATTKMDLVIVHRPNGKKLLSFLSLSYGIMADIDLESDKLRSLGEIRFTIWSLARVTNLRKYSARVSFKRAECDGTSSGNRSGEENKPNFSSTLEETEATSFNKEDDDLDENLERVIPNQCYSEADVNDKKYTWVKHETFKNVIDDDVFESEVPSDWETIEDEFINVFATIQPFIGSTALMAPRSTFKDGVMWLTLIDGSVSRANILKFLIGIESGTHMDVAGVSFFPITGLRIVPLSTKGKINIDGELVEFGPLQATILRECGTIMTRKKYQNI